MEEKPFDLSSLVDSVVSLFAPGAAQRGISFDAVVDASAQGNFVGDELRLRQVLLNLASNAVKFTEIGGVTLRASATECELVLEVEDTGIGIDDAVKPRLFQPFEQADSSMTRRFGGTGLGLSIAKRLIDLMGGSITIADRPGGGTTFRVALLLPQATRSARSKAAPANRVTEPALSVTEPELPILDAESVEDFRQRLPQDRMVDLARNYAQGSARIAGQIQKFLQSDDLALIGRQASNLLSISSNLGARRVADFAQKLQAACETGDADQVRQLVSRLLDATRETASVLALEMT